MFYPFLKDHRHTTPPTDFHLPRPQLAIIEKFECIQFFIFYFFVREYKKSQCCQPGRYPYILEGCNAFRALLQRTIDCFSKETDRAENSAVRPPAIKQWRRQSLCFIGYCLYRKAPFLGN